MKIAGYAALFGIADGAKDTIVKGAFARTLAVLATIMDVGRTLKPLAPVHPSSEWLTDGSLDLRWTRRARGAWEWPDLVDAPLVEQAESYVIGVGNPDSPALYWQATAPSLTIDVANMATLQSSHAGQPIWVRQIGSHSASDPLLLHTIS